MIVNYEWVPLCWNHHLCVYQSELGADQERISVFTSQWKPLIQLALCLWMYKYNCAGECEIAKRIWRQTWKGIHYGHFFTSAPFNETSPLTLFGSWWNLPRQKFCIMNFLSGGFLKKIPEFLSHTRGEKRKEDFHWEICHEEKANSPRRAPGMVWTASEVELTPSASLQQNVVRWILYTLDI